MDHKYAGCCKIQIGLCNIFSDGKLSPIKPNENVCLRIFYHKDQVLVPCHIIF